MDFEAERKEYELDEKDHLCREGKEHYYRGE